MGSLFTQQGWYDKAVKTVMKQTELCLILQGAHRLLTDRLLVT